jgi:deoxycytidylate deaminase
VQPGSIPKRQRRPGKKANPGQPKVTEPGKPEIIVGLVGAAGTDLRAASKAVTAALGPYGYQSIPIRLSTLMQEVRGGDFLKEGTLENKRIWEHMDAGDAIRDQAKRNDAVAGLAIGYISEHRKACFDGAPALGTAFVLDSLKHPAEVELMRRIYRDRFVLISVHSTTEERFNALKSRIANSHEKPDKADDFTDAASLIMKRDEHDDDHGFGQNVREAFTEGDVYVSTQPAAQLAEGVTRYFQLFFGDPFITPTRDEYAMFQTHAAALRSADLSRQVGAAICTDEGEIIAVGCNEVPRPFGGQYWLGDTPDQRDFQLGYDSNVKQRDEAFAKAFKQLRDKEQLADGIELSTFVSALSSTRLANLTEFGRTVHAEMAALLDAARRGASVRDSKLFTTTFPCHNCARHIIGGGIKEVVYREPYEKSMASELHKDAIVVDPANPVKDKVTVRRFVGVGPPMYIDLFTKPKRKNAAGNRIDWTEANAVPRLVKTETAYLTNEDDFLDEFRESIASVELKKGDTRWR